MKVGYLSCRDRRRVVQISERSRSGADGGIARLRRGGLLAARMQVAAAESGLKPAPTEELRVVTPTKVGNSVGGGGFSRPQLGAKSLKRAA